jgi:predicted  nucleic acid-binding Zn-ribbon protein
LTTFDIEENVKRLESTLQALQFEMKTKLSDTSKLSELEESNQQLQEDIDQLIVQKETLEKELESAKDSLKNQELSKGDLVNFCITFRSIEESSISS